MGVVVIAGLEGLVSPWSPGPIEPSRTFKDLQDPLTLNGGRLNLLVHHSEHCSYVGTAEINIKSTFC